MSSLTFTPSQTEAVETTGTSVLVSASAGSGKTSVLAQRCAYLVCDAPEESRCNVDELLVLTFTEAAAGEMRSRIVETLRDRLQQEPSNGRLRDQIAHMDSAQISTIHSFCLWMLRRWFSELDLDPLARLMDEHESRLLKSRVVDEVFLYSYENDETFESLVTDYGLGKDDALQAFVLRLYELSESVPDPDDWLSRSLANVSTLARRLVSLRFVDLLEELILQSQDCMETSTELRGTADFLAPCADCIEGYAGRLNDWREQLETVLTPDCVSALRASRRELDTADWKRLADLFERVRSDIADFKLKSARAPTLPKDAPDELKAARDWAAKCLTRVNTDLLTKRLQARYGLFSISECLDGLERTRPYVKTITELVRAFRATYQARKREMSAMDFSDLERLALQLLRSASAQDVNEIQRYLQSRFAHVLVDEFQDINPIQHEIIRRVSRESSDEATNNLFCVGDIKQSIYGFRLADPTLFGKRFHRFASDDSGGRLIALQDNFRSREEILDAVNHVFESLMVSGGSDVVYDDKARMSAGDSSKFQGRSQPIEVHLLERTAKASDSDKDQEIGEGAKDFSDPSRWSAIQREAFLIGTRIHAWMKEEASPLSGKRLSFGDIVILLRAPRFLADQMSDVLNQMGIPSVAEAGGSLMDTREVRDVIASLQLLDNQQQDIPLAAAMRSGIFGDRFNANELATIRAWDLESVFSDAVPLYADEGDEEDLSRRVASFLSRVDQYREMSQRRPLAEVLGKLFREGGFFAYTLGLPDGKRRNANLLKLQDVVRGFDALHGCGLSRFLSFVKHMEEEEFKLDVAASGSDAEDAVRIMSIHHSKGLEFPVVFVAGLGNRFNLGDRDGRMIVDREGGIGLRVVDRETMVEYPSISHASVARDIERTTRDEELRILYVAMTRAESKLVLVGSVRDVEKYRKRFEAQARESVRLSQLAIASALSPLDWLGPVILGSPASRWVDGEQDRDSGSLYEASAYTSQQMSSWRLGESGDHGVEKTRTAVSRLEPLPEPVSDPSAASVVGEIVDRLERPYSHWTATTVRSSIAASEAKRANDPFAGSEERDIRSLAAGLVIPPSRYGASQSESPAYRGIVTHRILQHLDFTAAKDEAGLARELQRLWDEKIVEVSDCDLLDRESLAWFLRSPLADRIRVAGDRYRREFLFTASEPARQFEPAIEQGDDQVLVRGIVDGILPVDGGIEIIDFKTDRISKDEIESRTMHHRPQMDLYARTLKRIWRRPVKQCWLVFLSPRDTVSWVCPDDVEAP